MRYQGRITRWNDDRGFGFITPNGSRNLVFVYIKAFTDRPQRPVMNELVYYELNDDQCCRPSAENVTFVSDEPKVAASFGRRSLSIVLGALLLVLVVASAVGIILLK